jgi:hypothetical protein
MACQIPLPDPSETQTPVQLPLVSSANAGWPMVKSAQKKK